MITLYGARNWIQARAWKFNSQLTDLVLRNCSIPQDVWCQLFRLFHSFKNITQLNCSQNNIGKGGGLLANAISELVRLMALYLNSCTIPEDQCIQIIQSLSKSNNSLI